MFSQSPDWLWLDCVLPPHNAAHFRDTCYLLPLKLCNHFLSSLNKRAFEKYLNRKTNFDFLERDDEFDYKDVFVQATIYCENLELFSSFSTSSALWIYSLFFFVVVTLPFSNLFPYLSIFNRPCLFVFLVFSSEYSRIPLVSPILFFFLLCFIFPHFFVFKFTSCSFATFLAFFF